MRPSSATVAAQDLAARIVENIPTAVAYFDAGLICRYANLSASRLMRRSAGEIVGLSLAEIVGPDTEIFSAVERCVREGKSFDRVFEFPTVEDPSVSRFFVMVGAADEEDGQLVGAYVQAFEVTGQMRREFSTRQQLARSQALLEAILDNSQAAIYAKDTESRFILNNRTSATLLGSEPAQMLGRRDEDFIPSEIAEQIYEHDAEIVRTGSREEYEETIPTERGAHTYVSVKFPLKDSEGRIFGVGGISTDITDRKQAEEHLRVQAEELEAVFASMADAVMVLGGDGRVTRSNDGMKNLIGGDLRGAVWREVLTRLEVCRPETGEPIPIDEIPSMRALAGTASTLRFRVDTLDGRRVTIEGTSTPLLQHGSVIGAVAVWRDVTEQERLRNELQVTTAEAEAVARELDAMFHAMLDAVVVFDMDGRIIRVNQRAIDMLGMDPMAMDRKDVSARVQFRDLDGRPLEPPEYPSVRAQSGEAVSNHRLLLTGATGRTFTISVSASRFTSESGAGGVVAVWRDISGQERLTRELAERNERISSIVESIGDAFFTLDSSWHFTYVNSRAEQTLGIRRDDLLGRSIWDVYPDAVGSRFWDAYHSAIAERRPIVFEDYYSPLSAWLEVRAFPYQDGLSVFFADVTERKRSEEQLKESRSAAQESERRLRAIMDSLPVGVFIADEAGCIVATNRAVSAIWGGEPPAAETPSEYGSYRARWSESGETLHAQDWAMARALAHGEVSLGEVIDIERFDGSKATILNSAVPLYDDAGGIIGAVAVIQDITERRVLEQERDAALIDAQAERSQLEAVLLSMTEGVIIGDGHANVLEMNDEALRLHGFDDIEQIRRHLKDWPEFELRTLEGELVPQEDWPLGRVARGERFANLLLRVENRKTGDRWVWSYSGSPVYEAGKVERVILTVRDVTEAQRGAEERERLLVSLEATTAAATERARLLDSVISSMADGVVIYDTQGHIVRINEQATKLFGYTPDDFSTSVIDRTARFAMSDERGRTMPPSQFPPQRALNGEPVRNQLVRLAAPDRPAIWMSVSAAPLYDGPTIVGAVGTFLDVTVERELTERQRALVEELGEANRELTAISQVTDVAITTLEIDALLRSLLERLVAVMRADAAIVLLASGGNLRTRAAFGLEQEADAGFQMQIGEGFAGWIAEHRRHRYLADAQESNLVKSPYVKGYGVRSMLGVPLEVGDELVGVVHVDWVRVRPEDPRDLSLLQLAGDRIALAIRNAQLYEERRRAADLGAALNEIDSAISSTLEFDEIMDAVLERTAQAIGADAGVVYVSEEDRWRARFVYGLPANEVDRLHAAEEIEDSATAAEQPGNVILIDDAQNDARVDRQFAERYGINAVADVALTVAGRLVGDFAFYCTRPGERFTEQHADFLRKVAASVTLALQNARLYAEERNVADTLQRALLAVPESIEGLEFECLYQSAAETAAVGGDFYDLFEMEDRRVGVMIGDVSGKGLEASTLTSLVRTTVRAYAYDLDSPAAAIQKANEVITRLIAPGTFITMMFGIFDASTNRFTYCNAGHPPAMVLRQDGVAERLRTTSPLVGAFTGLEYVDETMVLSCGEILFLYTDGTIEARAGDELFGEERLLEAIQRIGLGVGASGMPRAIFEVVGRFAEGEISDDVAMLALTPQTPACRTGS